MTDTSDSRVVRSEDASIEAQLRRKILIGFFAALVLTGSMDFLAWHSAQQAANESDWATHTQLVMTKLESAVRHIIDVETGARGFALIGQEAFLQPYLAGQSAVGQDLDELRHLTADNPAQQRRLDVLEPQILTAARFAKAIVVARQQTSAIPSAVVLEENQRCVDAVSAIFQQMSAEEERLLIQRAQTTRAGRRLTSWITAFGTLLGWIILILAGFTINREIGVSVRARGEITALNATLEHRVDERTAALNAEITERKRAEKALREQAEELERSREALEGQTLMLQSVLDNLAEGLVAADAQGKFILWNGAAKKMLGYGLANIPTQDWAEHFGAYLPDKVTRFSTEQLPLIRAIRGETCTCEIFLRNPKITDGVWIEASASPLTGKDGVLRGGVVALRDVTRSKADEREIRKLNEGLEQRVAELARSNADLEQFAYVASHDLQEPLRMVASYTQLLSERYRGRLDANADKYIGYASEGALRMQVLIQDLLAFSRVGRSGGDRERIDCNTVLETVKLSLAAALHESGAVITCPELPAVWADGPQLAQVFQNIIGNAIKFRKAMTPEIEIRVEKSGLLWLFSISDNGIGIAPEYAENIFVVFQRLHARTEYPGNGIGLAICKKIVEYYGGKIWVESQSGQGSTFKFTLPAVIAQEVTLRPELVGAHS